MSFLQTLQKLRAVEQGRAVNKTTFRHVHLSESPLIISGYHLAGDIGAPLALMWGTSNNSAPNCVVVPEPRDRECRFEALDTFSLALIEYIEQNSGSDCAPQFIVPNEATANWLFGIVGRFTRHLDNPGKNGEKAAPPSVPLAGKHLSFFNDLPPGSSLVLPMTKVLSWHWVTGQMPSEDLNLIALLGWIAPWSGKSGPECAVEGEKYPPAGPISDPNWDAFQLTKIVKRWHDPELFLSRQEIRTELEHLSRKELLPGWRACQRGLQLLQSLEEAKSVETRWKSDCTEWGKHKIKVDSGMSRFKSIPTPTQSAYRLAKLERETQDFEADMAFDDPLVMARYITSGEALSAEVVKVDLNRKILVPGKKNRCLRPLIRLNVKIPFGKPVGTVLFLSSHPDVEFELISLNEKEAEAQVIRGANTAKTLHKLPLEGGEIVLTSLRKSQFYGGVWSNEIPWTHQENEDAKS